MYDIKKVFVLIPARAGSKRVKNKNVRQLAGLPLLAWSVIPGIEAGLKTFVSTDSKEYADIALSYGAQVIDRPPELAADGVGDREVIEHFLSRTEYPCDLVVYLRPTTPFRAVTVVTEAVNTLISSQNAASGLRSLEEMGESTHKCFYVDPGPYLKPLRYMGEDLTDRPNQECPRTYKPNGYVDIARVDVVEAGGLWGGRVIAYMTPRTCEIDTEDDWEYAEYLAQKERRFEFGKTHDQQLG